MRWPWDASRTDEEKRAADERVSFALGHLGIALREMREAVERINDKERRGFPTHDG